MAEEKGHEAPRQADRGQRDRARGSARPPQDGLAEDRADADETLAEREYEDYALAEPESDGEGPDVLLDVPTLKVDEISLEVEELRARVSLQAEVLDLVRLNVGADVALGRVGLEITGVEAQALLKVRLDNVTRILDRVLTTIDRNPQIVEQLAAGVWPVVEDVGGRVGMAAADLGDAVDSAIEDVGVGAGSAIEDLGAGPGAALEDLAESAGTVVDETGDTARPATRADRQPVRRPAGRAGKTARKAKAAAQPDAEERGAGRPRTTGGRRTAKRSSGRRDASDDQ